MCLLIIQRENTNIDDGSLKNAFDSNPDGVGYSFVDSKNNNPRMVTKKFKKYKKFLDNYKADILRYNSDSVFLLHFRLATHGIEEGTFNVHPFKVREGMMFAHNGIISDVDDDRKLSDTQVFNRDILQDLPKNFLESSSMIKLIEGFIGSSKLAFLNLDGSFKILNADLGHWKDNIWFSNSSYEDRQSCYSGYNYVNGYGYQSNALSLAPTYKSKEKDTFKTSSTPSLLCEWCGDKANSLQCIDMSDRNSLDVDDKWICDVCVDYQDEVDMWNDSFMIDG